MPTTTRPRKGFTRLTPERGASMPSGIILVASDGSEYGLWFDTTGDLRTAGVDTIEASNFNPNSSGTVVGSQS